MTLLLLAVVLPMWPLTLRTSPRLPTLWLAKGDLLLLKLGHLLTLWLSLLLLLRLTYGTLLFLLLLPPLMLPQPLALSLRGPRLMLTHRIEGTLSALRPQDCGCTLRKPMRRLLLLTAFLCLFRRLLLGSARADWPLRVRLLLQLSRS